MTRDTKLGQPIAAVLTVVTPPPDTGTCSDMLTSTVTLQELAKLLEDQHGYIDLQNIPENKYYSMDKNPDEDEKL